MATILVVDDRASNRHLLTALLGYGGHRLLEAANGVEALELVRAERPELVITDILMPTMDGYEFVQKLRGEPGLAATPVIFYTATYSVNDADKLARSCGVLEVLAKPSEPQAIFDAVNRSLGLRAQPPGAPPERSPSKLAAFLGELEAARDEAGNFIAFQRFTTRLVAIEELSVRMVAEREPAALVAIFIKAARRILGAGYAAIGMLDRAQAALASVAAEGFDAEVLRAGALDRNRLPGRLFDRKLPLRAVIGAEDLPPGHPAVNDFLGLPLTGRAGAYGWVYFANVPGGGKFSEEDEQIAAAMAAQLAMLYENAAQNDAIRRHAAELQFEAAERIRVEGKLRDSELRHRATFEWAAVGIVHSDLNGRLVMVNSKFSAMSGYAQGELQSHTFRDLTHPDDLQPSVESRARLLDGTSPAYEREARVVCKDGSIIWANITTSLVRRADGTPSHFISILHDVTGRRNLEHKVREAELMYRAIFENAVEGIFLVDAEGRVISSNPRLARMLGYASPGDMSREIASVARDVYVDRGARARFRELIDEQGVVEDFETQWRRRDGSTFWASLTGRRIRDETGGLIHLLGMARDITDRKQAETRIRRLNRVYAVLSGVNTLIVRVRDRDALFRDACRLAVETGGFCAAAVGIVDRAAGQVLPAAWHGVSDGFLQAIPLGPRDAAGNERGMIAQAVCEGRSMASNDVARDPRLQLRQASAALGFNSLAVLPLLVDKEAVGVLVLGASEKGFFDADEIKLLDELAGNIAFALNHLERNRFIVELTAAREDAEQANRAKSAFLATMSHEIRTPMNGVIGILEVLAQGKLSEQQRDLVNTIRESGATLLGIIDDILDFSKIEAGRLEIERLPVSVTDLVEGLAYSLAPVAEKRGVDLSLFISPAAPEAILSDDVRLRQVLYNLVGNAIKFSGGRPARRGRVSMRVEVTDAAPPRLRFRVTDNGIGMTYETQSGLFTPFTQAEISTTRRFGGTGLGLAICKRLVDLMQGEIAVQSSFDKGSTFTVCLPVEAVPSAVRSVPDLHGVECVVVGGPTVDADDVRAYLEHAGAGVLVATGLEHAAQSAIRMAGPVVLVDTGRDAVSIEVLREAFAALPNPRYVLIAPGRRRSARIAAPEAVRLDCDVLRRRALLRAVMVAAGRASPEAIDHGLQGRLLDGNRIAPSVAEARAGGRLILVAEDDEINQKVILQQLGLLGYGAEMAANGAEALHLWREGDFAVLLTDLHMPEMDGYELAQSIRREEAGARRMPILALTANALRGEANRARAAGIDEYLTKPVQLRVLGAALEKWLPRSGQSAARAPAAQQDQHGRSAQALDVSVLRGLVGDDAATVNEFLTEYLSSARRLATELRAACAAHDARQVGSIAHKLKSSSRSVGALVLGDLCAGLENAVRSADKAAIAQELPAFEGAFAAVESQIVRLLPSP